MKIRNGFVSNSSSSSFLIYGSYLDKPLDLLKERFGVKDSDDFYDKIEELCYQNGLEWHCPHGVTYGGVSVGVSWDDIKDDETGAQFRARVTKTLRDLFGDDIMCSTLKDAWSDT